MVGKGGENRAERTSPEAMPRRVIEQRKELGAVAQMVTRFVTEHGAVSRYSVTLLAWRSGRWTTVRVFDNAHGEHEMHRYTQDGSKQPGEPFHHGSASEAMSAARLWVMEGWEAMVEAWRR